MATYIPGYPQLISSSELTFGAVQGVATEVSNLASTISSQASQQAAYTITNQLQMTPSATLGLTAPQHGNLDGNPDRNFNFILVDNLNSGGTKTQVYLNVNPEDIAFDSPYCVNSTQTMGGVFVDIWGAGINRITLRGNTGWHTQSFNGQTQDGFDNLFNIRDQIIGKYHQLRQQAASSYSMTDIQNNLYVQIIDTLHQRTYTVVPDYFKLLRNKQRPLLHIYEMSFVVVTPVTNNQDSVSSVVNLSNDDLLSEMRTVQLNFNATYGYLATQQGSLFQAILDLAGAGYNAALTMESVATQISSIPAQQTINTANAVISYSKAISAGIGSIQSTFQASGIPADQQLWFANIKNLFNELACLSSHIANSASAGVTTMTGIVTSSACAAAAGMPVSQLDSSSNSLLDITASTQSNSNNVAITNSSAGAIVNNINTIDVPLTLFSS